jgi:hypothetical protein
MTAQNRINCGYLERRRRRRGRRRRRRRRRSGWEGSQKAQALVEPRLDPSTKERDFRRKQANFSQTSLTEETNVSPQR